MKPLPIMIGWGWKAKGRLEAYDGLSGSRRPTAVVIEGTTHLTHITYTPNTNNSLTLRMEGHAWIAAGYYTALSDFL
jgi:hypothetical protein